MAPCASPEVSPSAYLQFSRANDSAQPERLISAGRSHRPIRSVWSRPMRVPRPILAASVLAIASLTGVTGVAARTPVDPTSLTPPLKAFRVCYEEGPFVHCDTSGVDAFVIEPTDEAPCGLIYETSTEVSHSTRWYQDGLIIRRAVQVHVD